MFSFFFNFIAENFSSFLFFFMDDNSIPENLDITSKLTTNYGEGSSNSSNLISDSNLEIKDKKYSLEYFYNLFNFDMIHNSKKIFDNKSFGKITNFSKMLSCQEFLKVQVDKLVENMETYKNELVQARGQAETLSHNYNSWAWIRWKQEHFKDIGADCLNLNASILQAKMYFFFTVHEEIMDETKKAFLRNQIESLSTDEIKSVKEFCANKVKSSAAAIKRISMDMNTHALLQEYLIRIDQAIPNAAITGVDDPKGKPFFEVIKDMKKYYNGDDPVDKAMFAEMGFEEYSVLYKYKAKSSNFWQLLNNSDNDNDFYTFLRKFRALNLRWLPKLCENSTVYHANYTFLYKDVFSDLLQQNRRIDINYIQNFQYYRHQCYLALFNFFSDELVIKITLDNNKLFTTLNDNFENKIMEFNQKIEDLNREVIDIHTDNESLKKEVNELQTKYNESLSVDISKNSPIIEEEDISVVVKEPVEEIKVDNKANLENEKKTSWFSFHNILFNINSYKSTILVTVVASASIGLICGAAGMFAGLHWYGLF